MESLESKADPNAETKISESIKEGRCTCGGELNYLQGKAVYMCNKCLQEYTPTDVLT